MVTWISHRLLKPNVSQSFCTLPKLFLFLYSLSWQVEPPKPEIGKSYQTLDPLLLSKYKQSFSFYQLSHTSFLKTLPSLPSIVALNQVSLISPQDYSSNLLIVFHSSNHPYSTVPVFFNLIIFLVLDPTRWILHPEHRQRTWTSHLTEETNTHLYM